MIKNYLWMLPFICFILSYSVAHYFFSLPQFPAPSVTGKSLDEALTIISNRQLSGRLLRHQPEPDLPPGIVTDQIPPAGQMVKERQALFLTISESPHYPRAPQTIGKSIQQAELEAQTLGLKVKSYHLKSNYPHGQCIGQIPAPGAAVSSTFILYIAHQEPTHVILPNFSQHPLEEVLQRLALYQITPEVHGSQDGASLVSNQRPQSGSIISVESPITVQLTT